MNSEHKISAQSYKNAADRVRTGRARPGDEAVCDAWDAQWAARPRGPVTRSIWDLPIARRMWRADARQVER